MRSLSINEINDVTGAAGGLPAGYSENIMTAAASIYVGTTIGGVARTLSTVAFKGLAGVVGAGIPGAVISLTGSIVSSALFFAAPMMVFDAIYPGVIAEKVNSFMQ